MKGETAGMEMVRFQDMPYTHPDIEGLERVLKEAAARMQAAQSYAEARKVFFDVQDKQTE